MAPVLQFKETANKHCACAAEEENRKVLDCSVSRRQTGYIRTELDNALVGGGLRTYCPHTLMPYGPTLSRGLSVQTNWLRTGLGKHILTDQMVHQIVRQMVQQMAR